MKTHFLRYTALTISLFLLMIIAAPSYVFGASDIQGKTELKLSPGISMLDINGVDISIEKPYYSGKILYIPLRPVLESIGADVLWQGNGKINVIFRDASVDLTVGKTDFFENQTDKKLSAPPVLKDKTVMIPVDMISECFDAVVSENPSDKQTTIILNSDGSLGNLSFLTGSLTKSGIGNSYFGWDMNIPKGSRITVQSFNSKSVEVENEQHGVDIDISANVNDGKKLDQYYSELIRKPISTY